MAYTPVQDNTQNKSLTSKELMPTLVGTSAFLMYQKGVVGEALQGETIPVAQLAGALEDYTGGDLTGDTTADAGGVITVNQSKAWSRSVLSVDQQRAAIGGLAEKYGVMYVAKMGEAVSASIAAEGATTTTIAPAKVVSLANVEDTLQASIDLLRANGVARSEINAYVPSFMYNLVVRATGRNIESTNSSIKAGVAIPFLGVKVHESTNLAAAAVGVEMIVCADWALQYGIGYMESTIVENNTIAKNFGRVTKGVAVWGSKVLDVKGVVKTDVSAA